MREGSFHLLTPGLIGFIACAGTCTLSQTGLHEYDASTCRCVRLTRMYVCARTRVCVCTRLCVCACVFLSLFLSLSLSLFLFLFLCACMRARSCVRRVVLCWVDRATRSRGCACTITPRGKIFTSSKKCHSRALTTVSSPGACVCMCACCAPHSSYARSTASLLPLVSQVWHIPSFTRRLAGSLARSLLKRLPPVGPLGYR